MSQTTKLRSGVRMAPEEAKAYVDHLYTHMYEHWKTKIPESPFMTQLSEGKLPMPVIRQFFKNWGHFSMDVNALNALSYHTHLPFFVRHYDLLGPFCAKIADELISPRAPGHVLVLVQTAEAMGLSKEEVVHLPGMTRGAVRRRRVVVRELEDPGEVGPGPLREGSEVFDAHLLELRLPPVFHERVAQREGRRGEGRHCDDCARLNVLHRHVHRNQFGTKSISPAHGLPPLRVRDVRSIDRAEEPMQDFWLSCCLECRGGR